MASIVFTGPARYAKAKLAKRSRWKDSRQKKVNYQQYIKSSEWFSKRAEFFSDPILPKFCVGCGDESREVDLHHLTYSRLGSELVIDLVPLCHDCHRLVHKMNPDAGRRGGINAFKKSLIYDFGISTPDVEMIVATYYRRAKELGVKMTSW